MVTVEDRDQWLIYQGHGEPHDGIANLPEPPPWRRFGGQVREDPADTAWTAADVRPGTDDRARVYFASSDVVDMVNAALYLRRPLLVTGKPGTGKSALAYNVAYELGLG